MVRTVTGTIQSIVGGAPRPNVPVTFWTDGMFTATATYPPDSTVVLSDTNGAFSVSLAVPAQYNVQIDRSYNFRIAVPSGVTPVSIEFLRISDEVVITNDIQAAIDSAVLTAISGSGVVHSVNGQHDIVVLDADDVGADPAGTAAAAIVTHVGLANPHTQYLLSSTAATTYQPLDSDLAAIAALTTTAFGRALLILADAAAGRTSFELGTAALADTGVGSSNIPTRAQADALYQPLDSDLTAIAALSTTSFGRSVLELADAAALRTLAGLGNLSTQNTITASQISDASANGQSLITATDYATMRTLLALVIGTNVQAWDADLDAIAALTSTGFLKRTGANTWAVAALSASDIPDIAESQVTNLVSDLASKLVKASNLSDLTDTSTARSNLGLGNVENTALSTWAGTTNITTLGTIATGIWHGTKIGLAYGGTNADLSGTAGYLKQASTGADVVPVASIPHTDLSYTGLTAGQVLRASSTTAAEFSNLSLSDLPSNIINGIGASGQITFFTGQQLVASSPKLIWDNINNRLEIISSSNPGIFIHPDTTSGDAVLRVASSGIVGGAGGHAVLDFYDAAARGFRFIAAFGNSINSRYGGFIAGQDRDAVDLPLRFFTNDTSHAAQDHLFMAAGVNQGKTVLRSTTTSVAAGLYAPWKSGDSLPTIVGGVNTTGNNQIAVAGISDSEAGIQGTSNGGPGVRAITTSGNAIVARLSDASAANLPVISMLQHRTSATPLAGFGGSQKIQLQTTTTPDTDAVEFKASWISPTHASRRARYVLSVYDTAEREAMRVDAHGAGANIGFLGATDFGAGSGVLAILDRVAIPTSTPSGGHIYYSNSGLPTWKTSAGNTIGLAGNGVLTIPTTGTAQTVTRSSVADTNYTILSSDRYVGLTSITAARTFTLPAASSVTAGQEIFIKDESGSITTTNTLSVARAGSDTIDGTSANIVLIEPKAFVRLVSDGTSKWFVTSISPCMLEYTASVTDTIPNGYSFIRWEIWGPGGGGGAGRRGATTTSRGGGGGGGGGGYTPTTTYRIADLGGAGTSVIYTIPSGGTAGTLASADNTDGGNGGAASTTSVVVSSKIGAFASGGGGGGGGTTAGGTAGSNGIGFSTGSNGSAGTVNTTGTVSAGNNGGGSGGAGGGGLDTSDTNRAGGDARYGAGALGQGGNSAVGTGGTAGGGNGSNATNAAGQLSPLPTSSGGGGGSNNAGAGGTGGNAGRGCGGGGGGASQNGANSGAGGVGGGGYVRRYLW